MNERLQFRLATLFVATTAIAVGAAICRQEPVIAVFVSPYVFAAMLGGCIGIAMRSWAPVGTAIVGGLLGEILNPFRGYICYRDVPTPMQIQMSHLPDRLTVVLIGAVLLMVIGVPLVNWFHASWSESCSAEIERRK